MTPLKKESKGSHLPVSTEWQGNQDRTIIEIRLKTKVRKNFFGYVIQDTLHENTEGKITVKAWLELPFEFHNIKLLHYEVTPEEFHAVVEIDHIKQTQRSIRTDKRKRTRLMSRKDAKAMLRREYSQILTTKLISSFKYRTTKLLNQLHGTLTRVVWETGFEERYLDDLNLDELLKHAHVSTDEVTC